MFAAAEMCGWQLAFGTPNLLFPFLVGPKQKANKNQLASGRQAIESIVQWQPR